MANMSYCRWENTLADLRDCANDLEERLGDPGESPPLDSRELEAAISMFHLMREMLDSVDVEDWDDYEQVRAALTRQLAAPQEE